MGNKKNRIPLETIKFRGKRADNGEWVVGSLVNNSAILGYESKPAIIYLGSDGRDACEVLPETVGQFTGLKDKSENEVYEGDIIQGEYSDEYTIKTVQITFTAEIDFVDGAFMAKCIDGHFYGSEMRALFAIRDFGIKYSVVGNIYDNQELCKERESNTIPTKP